MTPGDYRVKVRRDHVRLDLGGIGKGYALIALQNCCWNGRSAGRSSTADTVRCWCWSRRRGRKGGRCRSAFRAPQVSWSAFWRDIRPGVPPAFRKRDHIIDPRTGLPVRNRRAHGVGFAGVAACSLRLPKLALLLPGCRHRRLAGGRCGSIFHRLHDPVPGTGRGVLRRHPGLEARILVSDPSDPAAAPWVLQNLVGMIRGTLRTAMITRKGKEKRRVAETRQSPLGNNHLLCVFSLFSVTSAFHASLFVKIQIACPQGLSGFPRAPCRPEAYGIGVQAPWPGCCARRRR